MSRAFPLITVVIAITAALGVFSGRGAEGVEAVNRDAAGLALHGYDAVAYFREGREAEGRAEFEHTWNGARWHFKTAENRDAFVREPEAYAPRYGGYCSYAVAHGYTADGDPRAWKIVDGRLYLNYSVQVRELWEQDIPGYLQKSEINWPRFLKHRPEHKG